MMLVLDNPIEFLHDALTDLFRGLMGQARVSADT